MGTTEEKESLQNELAQLTKKSKFKRKIVSIAVVFVVILITISAAWLFGRHQAKQDAQEEIAKLKIQLQEQEKKIQDLIETPIVVSPVSPEINLDIIHSKISDIGELATIEYLFTDAAEFSDSKQIKSWNIPFTEKSFILRWSGVIKAGVNLEQITIEVDKAEKKIIVSMPPAEILSYETESMEVLNEKNNIFNNISVNDKIKFDDATQDAMKGRAIENGLLEKAQKNAEDILSRLIQSDPAAASDYTIEYVIVQQPDSK